MATADTAKLIAELSLRDKMSAGLKNASGNLGKFQSGLGRTAQGLGKVQTGVVRAGTRIAAGLALGAAGAAKVSADFQSSFAGIQKTVDEADLKKVGLSFDQLRKSILDMSTEIPVAATTLADIGAEAGALGIRAQDISEFTEVVAKLGVTTNLSTDEASSALGHLGTILGLTGDDFVAFADTVVNLGNKGASTESDIIGVAERLASAGKQAGLTTNDILGLSSALASLRAGGNIEASGGAMSRVFANMAKEIALGSGKARALGKAVGLSIKQMQQRIDKGKGLPLLLDTLEHIRGLSPTGQARFLNNIGIGNTRDLDAMRKLAQNLPELTRQLDVAKDSAGALDTEAQTRFDTLNSKVTLLKNNLMRAGIEIGDGMLPAITRATDKLTELLKDPKFLADAKAIGQELGKAIDSVDWKEVIDTAKGLATAVKPALDIALSIAKTFNALPAEIKGATLAILGVNKLSGGLISSGVGDIVGGLGESLAKSLASSIPVFGKAFVQPVFVTNMGAAGLGGVGGAAAGGAGIIGTGIAFGAAAGGSTVGNDIGKAITGFINDAIPSPEPVKAQVAAMMTSWFDHMLPNPASIEKDFRGSIQAIKDAINPQKKGIVPSFRGAHPAGTSGPLTGGPASFAAAAARDEKFTQGIAASKLAIVAQVRAAGDTFDRATSVAKAATVAALGTVGGQVTSGTSGTTGAVNNAASRIVAGFHSIPAPIVNVDVNTNVTASDVVKTTVSKSRQGPSASRNGGGGGAGRIPG